MAKIDLTHPLIVNHARRKFQFFQKAGDETPNALQKAIAAALAKQWSKRPLNMRDPRNAARYGAQFAALEALVTAESEEMTCS